MKPETRRQPIDHAAMISKWRERMGFTVDDASKALGCTTAQFTSWANGTKDVPRYIGLACAALALGMTPYGEDDNTINKD